MSRRLDLSKFAGSDSEGEEDVPKHQLELTALKSKTFSQGITKKTKRDLEKEAEERKRIEEEKAAALVMAEIEREFEGSAEGSSSGHAGMRGFRGRPIGPGGGFVRAGGAPIGAPTSFAPPRGPAAMGYGRPKPMPVRAPSPPPPPSGPKPRGKRAMDSFLEEIKHNQNAREQKFSQIAKKEGSSVTALAAWETGGSGFDHESTNLFISNLPQEITEEILGLHFAKQGPVATVKIMWPRGDEAFSQASTRRGLTGFVSYMERKDAERAVKELDGSEWMGNSIRVGWSKPVAKPLKALFDITSDNHKRRRSRSRSRDRSPPRKKSHRSRSYSYSSSSSYSRSPSPRRTSKEKWLDSIPEEHRRFIKTVANRVKEHGKGFEGVLMEKERENPKFAFLYDDKLPDYHLYQSTLSSHHRIPSPPPETFNDDGYASLYSSDSAEDSEKERTSKGKLGRLARRRFEAMLRVMTGKRAEIARGMEFALKRAEAADEIADIICQSVQVDSTPVPRKIARLHLISDILHNSASPLPNVWRYRHAFEHRLPPVLAHLNTVEKSLMAYSGKISADVFRGQVGNVLDIWERWIVFNTDTAELFRAVLVGDKPLSALVKTPQGVWVDKAKLEAAEEAQRKMEETQKVEEEEDKFERSGFKSSFKRINPQAAPVAVAVAASASAPVAAGESVPLAVRSAFEDEDLDGEAMEDLDGEQMEDLDGEQMEDLDGEQMEDLDGEAM
ncbi:U2-associated protein SR140 [Cryptococcus neoformans Tu259-1]|uniref:U2-associated protein SR140 n=1 Tax=Cryptococcus neoformans Tu259-1 TaxID=1230072 RepID=A0A854Q9U1_CRYNE|nr:U2-associated protein SR140 [Cryptococcus neoformans var. grubii Tu259-1]OXG78984.1 U2-associated protein SR140 [Cryptococcus neoformans var. grubii MW-RSA36]